MSRHFYINKYLSGFTNRNKEFSSKVEQVFQFHRSLPDYEITPLIELNQLAIKTGVKSIYVKDESKRFRVKTFKSLGASWAIHSFLRENPGKYTFCTATDGNHGRAVAWSSRIHNQKAVVYMPSHSTRSRIRNIEEEGAKVHIIDGDYDLCVSKASKSAKQNGYILIQDTSWKGYEKIPVLITQGYYTQIHEIIQQSESENHNPSFDIVFLQSGVGSWAASLSKYLNETFGKFKPRIVIVEPLSADCILESIKKGKVSKTKGSQDTIMAGLNCGTPSFIAFDVLKNLADVFISISDNFAKLSLKILQNPLKGDLPIESCETGAAGLAGFLAVNYSPDLDQVRKLLNISNQSRIMVINTEGNTDPEMNSKIMAENLHLPWDKIM